MKTKAIKSSSSHSELDFGEFVKMKLYIAFLVLFTGNYKI